MSRLNRISPAGADCARAEIANGKVAASAASEHPIWRSLGPILQKDAEMAATRSERAFLRPPVRISFIVPVSRRNVPRDAKRATLFCLSFWIRKLEISVAETSANDELAFGAKVVLLHVRQIVD